MFRKSNKVLDIFEKQSWLYGCRSAQSKKYEKKILGFNKKTRTKLAFPPQQKNWHNCTTVLYTKYVRTKNYFPPDKKTNTTPQLYGTLSNKEYLKTTPISCQNRKLTQQHNWENVSASPRIASVFVSPSVILSVRKC